LKPERWGLPLVQEKYQEERACDKRHPYGIIIIIIIIIISLKPERWGSPLFQEKYREEKACYKRHPYRIIIIIIIIIIIWYTSNAYLHSVHLQYSDQLHCSLIACTHRTLSTQFICA